MSNHGGRQLDSMLPAAAAVAACKRALKEHGLALPLFVDGGIRRGSDILKCLAFGADFVFLGRPMVFGLSAGEEGLMRAVEILKSELERTMQLCGIRDLEQATSIRFMHVSQGQL